MNKLIYTAPELELLEMEVEQGFAASPQVDESGLDDYIYNENSSME